MKHLLAALYQTLLTWRRRGLFYDYKKDYPKCDEDGMPIGEYSEPSEPPPFDPLPPFESIGRSGTCPCGHKREEPNQ